MLDKTKKQEKMKGAIAFLVLGVVLVFAEETFDGHTIDEIIADQSLRQGYFDCLTDTKECTADGQDLKTSFPLALTKDCEGCSDRQKLATEKMIEFVSKNKPEHWKTLLAKYDPSGIYASKHPEAVAA